LRVAAFAKSRTWERQIALDAVFSHVSNPPFFVWRICGAMAEKPPPHIALTAQKLSFKSPTMRAHPFMFQYPAKTDCIVPIPYRFCFILFNSVEFCFLRMTNVGRPFEFVSDRFRLFPNVERTRTFVAFSR
jgi:hypothetical protein